LRDISGWRYVKGRAWRPISVESHVNVKTTHQSPRDSKQQLKPTGKSIIMGFPRHCAEFQDGWHAPFESQ